MATEATTSNRLPFNKEAVGEFVRDTPARNERIRTGQQPGRIVQEERQIEGVRGLALVVKPSGAAAYLLRYQVGKGKRRQRRCQALGRWGDGGLSLSDARAKALSHMAQVSKGGDPVAEEREQANAKAELTLRQLFDERVAKDSRRAERTLADYKLALEADVFPELAMCRPTRSTLTRSLLCWSASRRGPSMLLTRHGLRSAQPTDGRCSDARSSATQSLGLG